MPGESLEEFVRAGAVALRHPEAPPVAPARQLDALVAFARRGGASLAPLVTLRSTALERWLHVCFADSDRFADAILLERMGVANAEDAVLLRFLREAEVSAGDGSLAELAVDRAVRLEQASPWRYFEGDSMAAALGAVRGWQRRYRRVYAQHYRAAVIERDALLVQAAASETCSAALERLNGLRGLGAPEGHEAVVLVRAAITTLETMSGAPDAAAATTAGVTLGTPHTLAQILRDAIADAERALDRRLRRLAGALAGRALERADDDLKAVLTAITASEVDHLDRVLDDRLAARLEALLVEAQPPSSPLADVARRHPEVTRETFETAVGDFRRALEHAIAGSSDGRVALEAPGARERASTPRW